MQRSILLCLWACSFLFSCARKYSGTVSSAALTARDSIPESFSGGPDYSNLFFWAAHPYKHDPSDSIPAPLVNTTIRDSMVDVFFIHPTTLTSATDTSRNAALDDVSLNFKTDTRSILYQASAFNEARVFAPRYRQAHYRSYFLPDSTEASQAFDLAYHDIKAAFQYYLDHYNGGRPIIIASHSQGSTHAQRLLKEFFDGTPLRDQLVVAYILGMYIPPHSFRELTMCRDSTETGCLVAWRTYKKGYTPGFITKQRPAGMVTNPLTWKTTEEYAPNSLNKGGVISQFNTLRPGLTDARIHGEMLWIGRPRIPGSIFLRMKNFHIGDINLFYLNIRENMRTRIRAFRERRGS